MPDNTTPERAYLREVRRAISDPGRYVKRGQDDREMFGVEPLVSWQARAVMAALQTQVEVIPVAPLLRWLDEQEKATMDEHRNFRSDYDEGRFDAFETVEAHIEGRDTDA